MPSTPNLAPDDDDDATPMILSQRTMTAISVIAVLALILGSASTVILLTDWGLNVAMIIGLLVAALLVILWIRLPKSRTRA